MKTTPAAATASRTRRASSTFIAAGFSDSTCLPASAARTFHLACIELGSGL
jgi:hypothetical protein